VSSLLFYKGEVGRRHLFLAPSTLFLSLHPHLLTHIVNMPESLAVVLDQGHDLFQLVALLLRCLHVPIQCCGLGGNARKRKRIRELVLAEKQATQ
jgi:hypothetical protein